MPITAGVGARKGIIVSILEATLRIPLVSSKNPTGGGSAAADGIVIRIPQFSVRIGSLIAYAIAIDVRVNAG